VLSPGFGGNAHARPETAEMPAATGAPYPAAQTTEMPPAPELASLGATAGGDHCANCDATMAADQRYCLECGERRGQARFEAPVAATSTRTVTEARDRPIGSRWSPGATLIAGVATLLLALGVGVLIGRAGNSGSSGNAGKVSVVTVNGAGGTAAAGAGTSTGTTTNPSSHSGASNKSHKAKSGSGASANAASATAKTVTALPPPTVTLGAKGSGAGYQHGHFTGNFFGGGG
jgi:hypothetical protein